MNFDHFVHHARRHPGMLPETRRRQLAAGQQPVALFIGCSDSRVVPSQITGAEPGKLFELRTAGNVVPAYVPDSASSEMATIEYAVIVLGVPEIIVCGHSHCGAVTALSAAGRGLEQLPAMRTWLGTDGMPDVEQGPEDPSVRIESKRHLRAQLDTLRSYPFIRERVDAGQLRLHGWFYEIDTGLVTACPHDDVEEFLPL
ncbi:carbonic anhydrase [Saccharopolyspora erythraea]|uniref:carbonic anhydrase n=1 Tax=Saccharopolyspora erythraea TaxID=1836 RepID=UPI001BAA7135|nr:carbonic anhydrase [Saccharopolyspora erythraea]QUH01588.1 carbonic anhydrase [Saccharopolyspora erythraea]